MGTAGRAWTRVGPERIGERRERTLKDGTGGGCCCQNSMYVCIVITYCVLCMYPSFWDVSSGVFFVRSGAVREQVVIVVGMWFFSPGERRASGLIADSVLPSMTDRQTDE